jgi:hypothetical protein
MCSLCGERPSLPSRQVGINGPRLAKAVSQVFFSSTSETAAAVETHRSRVLTDWYSGLLPVRNFIDTPAALMVLPISSSNKRCHGPIWILPSGGDHGAALSGQPIVDYRTPHVFVTNNLTGWPQWSPNGTMLALNTTNNRAGSGYPARAPFLLVAHFLRERARLRQRDRQHRRDRGRRRVLRRERTSR